MEKELAVAQRHQEDKRFCCIVAQCEVWLSSYTRPMTNFHQTHPNSCLLVPTKVKIFPRHCCLTDSTGVPCTPPIFQEETQQENLSQNNPVDLSIFPVAASSFLTPAISSLSKLKKETKKWKGLPCISLQQPQNSFPTWQARHSQKAKHDNNAHLLRNEFTKIYT